MSYEASFLEAIKRSERFGFASPSTPAASPQLLQREETQKTVHDLMVGYLGSPPEPRRLIGNCLATHINLKHPLEAALGTETFFTLGYVQVGDSLYHEFSERDIEAWLKHGIPNLQEFKGHAWLTLPSMEIVDFTFTATATSVWNRDTGEVCAGAIANHPTNLKGMQYHPVIVGDDVVSKIGAMGLIIFPILG